MDIDSDRIPKLLGSSAAIRFRSSVFTFISPGIWVFVYFYDEDFGVSLASLDVPFEFILVHAYTVLSSSMGVAIAIILIATLYIYAAKRIPALLMFAALVLIFPALFWDARHEAHNESRRVRMHPETVVHWIFKKPELAKYHASAGTSDGTGASPGAFDISALESAEKLHLLFETKDRIVVYYQPASIVTADLPAVYIYSVSRSDLEWLMVIAQ